MRIMTYRCMINSRSISSELWEQARQNLIFYFSRRHGITNAEDLAQETLLAILTRPDYEFAKEEDFLRVCYGFASRVSQQGYRRLQKHANSSLETDVAAPMNYMKGMSGVEIGIFLEEVRRLGKLGLQEKEWQLIEQAAISDRAGLPDQFNLGDANNFRVYLHRARKKLIEITGWRA